MSSFALHSMKPQPFYRANSEPMSYVMTLSGMSTLFPTRITTIFSSLLSLICSLHDSRATKESRLQTSYTKRAAMERRKKMGPSDLNLSWPRVSHIWSQAIAWVPGIGTFFRLNLTSVEVLYSSVKVPSTQRLEILVFPTFLFPTRITFHVWSGQSSTSG